MKHKINSKVSLVAFFLLSVAASLANAQSEPDYSRGDWVIGPLCQDSCRLSFS